MFIVCPSCSGPYRISADQIAPLVQVACPHCEYRVILDFEAANDPALREPGHQFAQGYETAADYFSVYSHVTKNPDARPHAAPGISAAAAAEAKPVAAVGGSPAKPTTPAATPTSGILGTLATPGVSSRAAKTVMHTPSKKPVPLDPTSEPLAPRAKTPSGPTMHAGQGTEKLPAGAPDPAATSDATPERRAPPHTPPVSGAISSGPSTPEVVPSKPEDPAAQSNSQLGGADKKPVEVVKPVETPADKAPVKLPVQPQEPGSAMWISIIIILILAGVGVGLYVMYTKS
jgi:predicted Zn finger-like uncharacterized protein